MVKIVRIRFPPRWQGIDTILLLITNNLSVVPRIAHKIMQETLLPGRKSRIFITHAHAFKIMQFNPDLDSSIQVPAACPTCVLRLRNT